MYFLVSLIKKFLSVTWHPHWTKVRWLNTSVLGIFIPQILPPTLNWVYFITIITPINLIIHLFVIIFTQPLVLVGGWSEKSLHPTASKGKKVMRSQEETFFELYPIHDKSSPFSIIGHTTSSMKQKGSSQYYNIMQVSIYFNVRRQKTLVSHYYENDDKWWWKWWLLLVSLFLLFQSFSRVKMPLLISLSGPPLLGVPPQYFNF